MGAALSRATTTDQPGLVQRKAARIQHSAALPSLAIENGPGGEGSRPGPHLGGQVLTGLAHRDRFKDYFDGSKTVSIT
jgi:hypothetical protein